MKQVLFESKLLPDGHLFCPEKYANRENVHFKVIATFDETDIDLSEGDIELSSVADTSNDGLTKKELDYYLSLEEL